MNKTVYLNLDSKPDNVISLAFDNHKHMFVWICYHDESGLWSVVYHQRPEKLHPSTKVTPDFNKLKDFIVIERY